MTSRTSGVLRIPLAEMLFSNWTARAMDAKDLESANSIWARQSTGISSASKPFRFFGLPDFFVIERSMGCVATPMVRGARVAVMAARAFRPERRAA